jgi:hypothetical protein
MCIEFHSVLKLDYHGMQPFLANTQQHPASLTVSFGEFDAQTPVVEVWRQVHLLGAGHIKPPSRAFASGTAWSTAAQRMTRTNAIGR